MKKSKLLFVPFVLLLALLFFSFSSENKTQDAKLVGVWKGFEVDKQIEGVEKHWVQQRFKNGKFVIMFTSIENCQVKTFTETGKWWTENGKFFEITDDTKDTDVYNYEVKDGLVVEFKSIKLLGEPNTTYIFSDYKINVD